MYVNCFRMETNQHFKNIEKKCIVQYKSSTNKTTAAVCISRRALKGKKYLFRDIHNDFIGQGHYSKGNGEIKVRP